MANQPDEHKRTDKRPPVFDDKATRDKIDRHMSDINDKITEEDIRNINTEPNEHYRVEKENKKENSTLDGEVIENMNEVKNEKKGEDGMETPWNILGS